MVHVIQRHIQDRYHVMTVITAVNMKAAVNFAGGLNSRQQFGITYRIRITHYLGEYIHKIHVKLHIAV